MRRPYGLCIGLRKAAIALCCLFFTWSAQAAAPRLLILGDSLTAGYGLSAPDAFQAKLLIALKAAGYDVTLVDAAVSGDTTEGGRSRLDWALGDGADAAILELGANDGLRGLDPKAMEANLAAILDAFAQRKIPVLLAGMLAPPNMGEQYARDFAAVFERLGKRPGVVFEPFFLEGVAGDASLNQADHIHPNPAGVRIVVKHILPFVTKVLREVAK